jgi:hypothetical protein
MEVTDRAVEEVLAQRGFRKLNEGWSGELSLSLEKVSVTVDLPPDFPLRLPRIILSKADRERRFWLHVGGDGAVCIAPTTGFLIDDAQPGAVVCEALARAERALERTFADTFADELCAEFDGYWARVAGDRSVVLLLDELREPSPVRIVRFGRHRLVAANTAEAARRWSVRAWGRQPQSVDRGTLITLAAPLALDRVRVATQRELLDELIRSADARSREFLEVQARGKGWPWVVIATHSRAEQSGLSVAAFEFGGGAKRGASYRRREHVARHGRSAPDILQVYRASEGYLAERVGSSRSPVERASVAIVGCGAVGGHLATQLVAAGVRRMTLIDHDFFSVDNLRRHVLDMSHIGQKKAEALAALIERRSPHVQVDAVSDRVETVPLDRLTSRHDVLVFATGDGNIERLLNDRIHHHIDRIHVWLEPLGIGGHLLVVRADAQGCFRCLFQTHRSLSNRLSFVEPGKDFTRSIAGCGGEFVPFSNLDASRAGLEGQGNPRFA